MNPKERKILEAELQKVYTKQTHSFRDAGKAVWNTKGIRELLDGCTEYAGCYFKWQYCTIAGIATVYKGNIIKNLIMDCQSYTKYRPNETTGGIFVSWRRKEELPTGA